MAEESQDGQEKTEEPTSRKLEKAAEEGQVLSSKEMFVFTGIIMMFGLVYLIPYFSQMLLSYWAMFFDWSDIVNDKKSILDILYYALRFIVTIIFFISIPIFLVVVLTQIAVGGINFAPKALQFKGKKINPIEGLKRMFSQKALAELVKAILKVLLLFGLTAVVVYERLDDMIQLTERELSQAVIVMGQSFPQLLFVLLVGLAIIAAIDYFWQRHIFIQGLRMTKQEIKDEFKQTEGSPEVKAKIRRKQMEASANAAKQASALNDVKDATAVITNPTHFAVALKYEVGSKGAPTILALGKGAMAKAIMERAEQANITLFRSPLLARALFFTGEIGQEISDKLYTAVAVALAYIYKIDRGEFASEPEIIVPEDMQFNEYGELLEGK
ncbi:MAG: flagellar biosynthesis protein FlhB [Alphaproteobacteria bacterium]|jgi:flagellar biosynthetic protein FlhB|nr:MAG: flagellar biosynthesis protein FlhB [Alphaproteobacteria bacterium]